MLAGGPGQDAFERQLGEMMPGVLASGNETQVRAWWLFRMVYTPHPLREKLTLFWHNHFATSNAKVNNLGFMLGQNQLLRRHALGNFAELLQDISKDPAMMVWLDTNQSKKGMPNENYARELMELFSLGIGNYTEQDIREAARAFTGWEIKDGKYHFNRAQFDAGAKTVFGKTGNFTGEDIVKLCLEHQASALFLVRKLFRFFISETVTPPAELLEPLAARFRKTWDIADVVATILRSNLFFSATAYRARIKSPVDYAVGIVRGLGVDARRPERRIGTLGLAQVTENLGQKLFYPPTVKGWDGGPAWLNATTLLHRHNLALALTSTEDDRFGKKLDPAALVREQGRRGDEEIVDFFLHLFLQGDVPADSRARLVEYMKKSRTNPYPVYWTPEFVEEHRVRAVCHLALTLPEYQLD